MAPRTRAEFLEALTGKPAAFPSAAPKPYDLSQMVAKLPQPRILNPIVKAPPETKKGFMGPIGKFIEVVDTPRAAITSLVKELGDLAQGEGFSAKDWWNQTGDNIFFGEVMDDWGIDLPGPLDPIVGFIGDVALDPLTYLAGAGLAMRAARSGEVATSLIAKATQLRGAAKTAAAAGKTADATQLTTRAKKLTDAAVRVEHAKGAATAAGREALEEIGYDIGWRSTVFGTGRVGRKLVEKPVNLLTGGKFTRAMDARRARQIPKWIGDLEIPATPNQIADAMALLRKGDAAAIGALDDATRVAAQRAMKMPAQSKRFLGVVPDAIAPNGVLPWGTKMIEAVFPAPGRMLRAATQRGMIKTLDKALNTKQPIKALLSSNDPDMVLNGIEMRRANNGRIRLSSQFKTQIEPILEDVVVEARRLGVNSRDVQLASEMPFWLVKPGVVSKGVAGVGVVNPNLPVSFRNLDVADAERLYNKTRHFWNHSQTVFNDLAGTKVLPDWVNDLYAARFLSDEGSDVVFKTTKAGGTEMRIPFGGKQSPLKGRSYLSDVEYDAKFDQFVRDRTKGVGPGARFGIGLEKDAARVLREDPALHKSLLAEFDQSHSKMFMGEELVDEAKGVSIRDQMRKIGSSEDRYGAEFKDMYEGDFYNVASRYLRAMADESGRHKMFSMLADAGVLYRDPDVLHGQRLSRLTIGLDDASVGVEAAKIKAAMMAQAAEEGLPETQVKIAALVAEANVLEGELVRLIKQAEAAAVKIRKGQATYMEAFQPLLGNAHSINARLNAIEDLAMKTRAVAAEIEKGATGTGDWITTDLTKVIADARSAARQVIDNATLSAGMDDSIKQMEDILKVLDGHDPNKLNLNHQIKGWADKVAELRKIAGNDDVGTMGDVLFSEINDAEGIAALIKRIASVEEKRALTNAKQVFDESMLGQQGRFAHKGRGSKNIWESNEVPILDDKGRTIGIEPGIELTPPATGADIQATRALRTELDEATGRQRLVPPKDGGPQGTQVPGEASMDTFSPTYRPFTVKDGKIVANPTRRGGKPIPSADIDPLTGKVRPIQRPIDDVTPRLTPKTKKFKKGQEFDEGAIAADRGIQFAERMIAQELETARVLQEAKAIAGRGLSQSRAHLLDIETQIRLANAAAEQARASSSLTTRMTALDSHHEAVQAFNEFRLLRGFQTEMTDITRNAWGMSGFDTVVASAEQRELMDAVFKSLYRISDTGAMNDFFRKYDQFMGWWKAGAVSSLGGFSSRNFLGGAWVNTQIAGVDMAQHSKVWGMYKLAMKEGNGDVLKGAAMLKKAGVERRLRGTFGANRFRTASGQDFDYFDQIVQSGVARSGQVAGEIDTSLQSFARMARMNVGGKTRTIGRLAPWSSEFAPFYQLRNMNEKVEFMLRGAVGMDVMQKGGSIDDAISDILKYHFDYSPEALTQTERHIRRLIPFWRWQKNIVPVLVESMGRRPTAWSRLMQIKGELELQSDAEGMVPDYYGENWGIRLPFSTKHGRVYTLPDLPFKTLQQFSKEPTSPLRTFGEMMAPPLKAPLEIWSGKQVFADIPFTGRFQQVPHVYDNTPGLMELAGMFGKAKKNKRGEWKMRDHDIYVMDQFAPFLGRFRRMVPNESRYQRRVMTTWLSQVFGISVRTNDRFEKKNQIRQNNEDFMEEFRDASDLQARNI